MKTLEYAGAVGIFLLHCAVVLIALFGWLWPEIWPIYMGLVVIILLQDIFLGYCVLSRWEFALRRMLNPRLRYDYTFTSYYTYKLTHKRLSTQFTRVAGIVFLSLSLMIGLSVKLFA